VSMAGDRRATTEFSEAVNERTQIMDPRWGLRASPTFAAAFKKHFGRIKQAIEAIAQPGCLVVAVRGDIVATKVLPSGPTVGPGAALVIGRHEQCGFCLGDDPTIALRHLLVRASSDEQGAPEVRLLDLKTGQGFFVEGAGICEAAIIDGPAFLSVGCYGLMLFPTQSDIRWRNSPEDAWTELPHQCVVDRRNIELISEIEARPKPIVGRRLEHETHITVIIGSCEARLHKYESDFPADTVATLTLSGGTNEIVYTVSQRDLSRGVLVGRYDRCGIGGTCGRLDEGVSRVHLLLLEESGKVLAIDMASSNGTTLDAHPLSVAVIGDQTVFRLGKSNELVWRKTRRCSCNVHVRRG
jgi:hypothetical protein